MTGCKPLRGCWTSSPQITPHWPNSQTIGASARTLSRLFHDELGMTFYQWRTQLRIYHTLVLLADGHDTTHVAHACGWANPSSFIAAFTDMIGTTPGRYRTAHQRRTTP
jgi:AraC-like DNA-binding protein